MKSFYLTIIVFIFVLSSVVAQENIAPKAEKKYSPKEVHNFLTFGLNVLDNGGTRLPLDSKDFGFRNPFFLSFEHRISSRFSGALSLSSNKLLLGDDDKEYYSIDVSALYYFDEYLFNNKSIETYVGLGAGRYFLSKNIENTTFNTMIAGHYWLSNNIAISLELMGKFGIKNDSDYLLNLYKYNVGVVWNIARKNKRLNSDKFDKIADRIADRIIKIVYSNQQKKDSIEQVNTFVEDTIKQKEGNIAEVSPEYIKSLQEYIGDWYISIMEKDGKHLIDNVAYVISNSSDNDGTLWISDDKRGWWMQCKIKLDPKLGTFSAIKETNIYDKGTITISNGKIEKNAALSKSGHRVDKISFQAEFSYDPGHILKFEGHKNTGLKEDEY